MPVPNPDATDQSGALVPPVASPRLGTSGCDYTGCIEFDKKRGGNSGKRKEIATETYAAVRNRGDLWSAREEIRVNSDGGLDGHYRGGKEI